MKYLYQDLTKEEMKCCTRKNKKLKQNEFVRYSTNTSCRWKTMICYGWIKSAMSGWIYSLTLFVYIQRKGSNLPSISVFIALMMWQWMFWRVPVRILKFSMQILQRWLRLSNDGSHKSTSFQNTLIPVMIYLPDADDYTNTRSLYGLLVFALVI